MRRILGGVALALIATAACAGSSAPSAPETPWQERGFVAHALGSPPDGPPYTNSREAFDESYRNGFRAFEVDLVRLRDGVTVLAHDLRAKHYGIAKGTDIEELSSEQMRGRRYDGRWPVLFEDDLLELLADHDDAVAILDTKGAIRDQVAIARRLVERAPADVRTRLYPHVHFQEQLDALRRLDVFPGFVLSLYLWDDDELRDAPSFVERNRLDTVIVRPQVYTDDLRDALREAGARWIFVHSFTDPDEITPWLKRGLGVYSNRWIEPA
jgi:glycerophosphoryl diester phosphodiesterase